MAILEVLSFPDERLREQAKEVDVFNKSLKKLVSDMRETMLAHKGVGLAAPQVGVDKKVVVIGWNDEKHVVINPVIISQDGIEDADEGCLSFPGVYEKISRPTSVSVEYQDENGSKLSINAEGFLARIFCHEIEHLYGRLLIDNISPLKRAFLKKKMDRRAKH